MNMPSDAIAQAILYADGRIKAAEADRDRLAARVAELEQALRHIADGTWTPTTGDSVSPREYARAALAGREEQP